MPTAQRFNRHPSCTARRARGSVRPMPACKRAGTPIAWWRLRTAAASVGARYRLSHVWARCEAHPEHGQAR